jgi:hypothetical protein
MRRRWYDSPPLVQLADSICMTHGRESLRTLEGTKARLLEPPLVTY